MSVRKLLHSYWLNFAGGATAISNGLGVGVTAYSLDDALAILRPFAGDRLPELMSVKEDVQFSDLDPGHVVPNMLAMSDRGVWFPMLGVAH